jgi:ABC-type multidrug transport system ATPase subunit
VILTTHDISEITELAERITIIDKGWSLVSNETPYDLRAQSKTYSVKFYNE